MHPFSIFAALVVAAVGITFASPQFGYFVVALITVPFPVLWSWVLFKGRPRTGQLLFWLAALSSAHFAYPVGLFLSLGLPVTTSLMTGVFAGLGAGYIFFLNRAVPRAHAATTRVTPFSFEPIDPPHDD